MNSVCFQGKPFIITVIQIYAPTSNAEKMKLNGSIMTYKPSRTNTKKKDVLFIMGDWNAKAESQKIPGITGKFGLSVQKANRVWPRECTGHS